MPKHHWIKQLTRENTLFDRSLRALAYRDAIQEIGKATISNCILVGKGKVTSLYYDDLDYRYQQKIIIKEFKGKNIEVLGNKIIKYLEQGYLWAQQLQTKKLSKKDLLSFYSNFNKHHAHARGAILYGYWGEPLITAKLKKSLKDKVKSAKLDNTISILSAPKNITGILKQLYYPSVKVAKDKQKLINQLKLNKSQLELIQMLSWFTFFYEVGERVSGFLYDQLLAHLSQAIPGKKTLAQIEWYDPESFKGFLQGKKLSDKELKSRQQFWILKMINGKWKLLLGKDAKDYYAKNLEEKISSNTQVIKGTTACLGKAKGSIKIVITTEDQKKMNQGDILISPMTTPRLMTAIKKASAIVTDEGGMTAHAAIVSREFNIPCIVGTKVASKVLKDDDVVEVDASKGVVRKLD